MKSHALRGQGARCSVGDAPGLTSMNVGGARRYLLGSRPRVTGGNCLRHGICGGLFRAQRRRPCLGRLVEWPGPMESKPRGE
jgi:hypothetical protein